MTVTVADPANAPAGLNPSSVYPWNKVTVVAPFVARTRSGIPGSAWPDPMSDAGSSWSSAASELSSTTVHVPAS